MRGARMLARGRKRARERMDAECLVTRPGAKSWDEAAGEWAHTPVVVYSGECRLEGSTTGGRKGEAGSQLVVVTAPELHLPSDVVGVEVGDEAVLTKCRSRPSLVGRRYTVKEPCDGSQVTALRYQVEVADGR